MSVCAARTCSNQSFDGSSYYVDVDVYVLYYCILVHVKVILNYLYVEMVDILYQFG